MKKIAYVLIVTLFVTALTTPSKASAIAEGPSASGNYTFVLEEGLTKRLEFNATTDERSVTTGVMTYTDEAGAEEWDPDGDPPKGAAEFYMKAELTSLTIEHNRAVMGGTVRESSHPGYVGRWVQLVVEDSGGDPELVDKLSWCFCEPEPGGWVPQDAEDPRDQGAFMQWWATDYEQEDDKGILSENIIPGNDSGCPAFLMSTYEFPEVRGEGEIQVTP